MIISKVVDVGKALGQFVYEYKALIEKDGMERPLVILSFDKSHNLTEFRKGQNWSIYVKLHHTLTAIVALPIFSVFLSTVGKFYLFLPETRFNPSPQKLDDENWTLPAITEMDFGQLALPTIEDVTTLSEVVTDRWMCHLGHPLCVLHVLLCAI
jgi:hypothetical protein